MVQRKQSSRPRSLDPYKLLPLCRDSKVFDSISEEGQTATDKLTTVAERESIKRSSGGDNIPGTLTEQLKVHGGKPETRTFDLPVPKTELSLTFDQVVSSNFQLNDAYFRHRVWVPVDKSNANDVEYLFSFEDEQWLSSHPLYGIQGKMPVSTELVERIIDILEKKTGRDIPLPIDKALPLVHQLMPKHLWGAFGKGSRVVEDVHKHWISRRQKTHKPLFRRFWPITAPNDSSPNLTFRPRDKERYRLRKKRQNDFESIEKLKVLKSDFEMVHCLFELVRRRENLRRAEARLLEAEFEQRVADIVNPESSNSKILFQPEDLVGPLSKSEVDRVFLNVNASEVVDLSSEPTSSQKVRAAPEAKLLPEVLKSEKKTKKKKIKNVEPVEIHIERAVEVSIVSAPPADDDITKLNNKPESRAPPTIQQERVEVSLKSLHPQSFLRDSKEPTYSQANLETFPPIIPIVSAAVLERRRIQKASGLVQIWNRDKEGGCELANYTSSFAPASQFFCRTRLGRGGRLIVDRIPVDNSIRGGYFNTCRRGNSGRSLSLPEIRNQREVYSGPDLFSDRQDFIDPCKTRSETSQSLNTEIPSILSLTTSQTNRIASIYSQEDSEDESVEILEYPYVAGGHLSAKESALIGTDQSKLLEKKPQVKFRFVV